MDDFFFGFNFANRSDINITRGKREGVREGCGGSVWVCGGVKVRYGGWVVHLRNEDTNMAKFVKSHFFHTFLRHFFFLGTALLH